MEILKVIVGITGNVISILMFLSPVPTFWRIIKHRSTEDFESLPYVCILLNASLMMFYGLVKPGAYLVATVSGFGVLVETIFVILFLIYAPHKMRVKTAILAAVLDVGFLGAAVLVVMLCLHGETRISAAGILNASFSIVMYGSPLSIMKTVVTTKSVEFMPFLLSLLLFLNGAIWGLYALVTHDIFLGVPNGVGFILGTAQLVLYGIYRNAKPTKNVSKGLEEGQQYDPLIS